MAKPFVDIKLENRVMRHLLVKRGDGKRVADMAFNNMAYAINTGVHKEFFKGLYWKPILPFDR